MGGLMPFPLEAVPNFSEGRDAATLDAIGAAVSQHAELLDVHVDEDHNRSVFTLVGPEDALVDALLGGIACARDRIDLRRHDGAHPRIGAADVVRERDGGFPGVRALGLDLPRAGLAQVSMNVEDWEAAALHDIVARIEREARTRGVELAGSELVGLMPAGAAVAAAGSTLRIE